MSTPIHRRIVFVDVPPSPYTISRGMSFGNRATQPSPHHKENNPVQASESTDTSSSGASLMKRKLSEAELTRNTPAPQPNKKSKVENEKEKIAATGSSVNDFPNGHANCHQCGRKREKSDVVHCTFLKVSTTKRGSKSTRCAVKLCKSCLKNRYGESMDAIKSGGIQGRTEEHDKGENYVFKCPRCRDICNCFQCRKNKGLGPTGNLSRIARATGSSVAQILVNGNIPQGIVDNKDAKVEPVVVENQSRVTSGTPTEHKVKSKPLERKSLPVLACSKIPANLSLEEAEHRIFIREFVLRFGDVLQPPVSKACAEELENIAGRQTNFQESMYPNWVSEGCVRAIILGILGVIAGEENTTISKTIKNVMKEIRASGVNLSKAWKSLATLREVAYTDDEVASNASSDESELEDKLSLLFPDPLPPAVETTIRETRTSSLGVYIAQTAQMIPVIVALIEAVMLSAVIRQEIDDGVQEGKDHTRAKFESIKAENERWDREKKEVMGEVDSTPAEGKERDGAESGKAHTDKEKAIEIKNRRMKHKAILRDLEQAYQVIQAAYVPRFRSLGTDRDGRIYYALSPGAFEREQAYKVISQLSDGKKCSKGKTRRGKTVDGKSLQDWSYFIWCYGKRFPNCHGHKSSEIEDADEEGFWSFWQPEAIRDLGDYVAIKSGLILSDDLDATVDQSTGANKLASSSGSSLITTTPSLRSLVKGIREFAETLEWRLREEEPSV